MSDPSGFEGLYLQEYPRVIRLAHLILGSRTLAEDVAQEAFALLNRQFRRVSRYDDPGAWLRRVAIQQASRARRAWRVRLVHDGHEPETPAIEPDVDLMRAIASLPRMQRAAVVLHYLEDRPVAEIGSAARTRAHLMVR